MNGNIKKVDDTVNKFGKRREFMIIQNNIADTLGNNSYALACYVAIWRRAGSEFNLTVDSISNVLQCSTKTANKALQKLKDMGLLEEKLDRDLTGMAFTETQDGRRVPNNRRVYIIHSALKIGAEPPQMLTPGKFISAEFTANEIMESERTTPLPITETLEPAKEQQEKVSRIVETQPVLKALQSREVVCRDSKISMAIERRKEKVYRIAAENGLFSNTGKEKLLYWLKRFTKEVGRHAADDEVAYTANMLSGDSGYNLSGYIKRKALSELQA